MSVTSVGSPALPALAAEVVQGLLGTPSTAFAAGVGTDQPLGDQLSLSPAAQRLSQDRATPAYLRDAMLTLLMNGESQASNPASLLSLIGTNGPTSLLEVLGRGDQTQAWGLQA